MRRLFTVPALIHFIFVKAARTAGLIADVLAGQQSAADGVITDYPDFFGKRHGQQFHLCLTFYQIVHGLDALDPAPPLHLTNTLDLCDLPRGKVAHPRVQHLALPDQIVQRLKALFIRCVPIRVMQKIEIDIIGLKAFEAGFGSRHDVPPGQSPVVDARSHPAEDLCRNDQFITASCQESSEHLFRDPLVVGVCAVEKINAPLSASIEYCSGCLFIRLSAERHGSHAQSRDLNAGISQETIFHICPLK